VNASARAASTVSIPYTLSLVATGTEMNARYRLEAYCLAVAEI
jgi:hypothetical protein